MNRKENSKQTQTEYSAAPVSKRRLYLLIALPSMVTIIAVVALILLLHPWRANNPALDDLSNVKKQVAKHYLLPTDEEPALATVTDKSKLSSPFLQKSEDGDRLLIYQKAKVVIIYRPKVDRIVAVGPIEISNKSDLGQ